MNKNKKKLSYITMAALACGSFISQADAALYVSPVLRSSVVFDNNIKLDNSNLNTNIQKSSESFKQEEQNVSGREFKNFQEYQEYQKFLQFEKLTNKKIQSNKKDTNHNYEVTGHSQFHGDFIMKENYQNNVMKFGKNVPIFVALEKIVPSSNEWFIHIDDGLENKTVSWKGGNSWEDVLSTIAEQNNLYIKINNAERAIGISTNSDVAYQLAKKIPTVWRLSEKLSLRENISHWCKKAGWNLEWDPILNVDYPVVHGAVLTGKFVGQGGVIDQLLFSLKDNTKPLRAEFHTLNKVLLVTNAGYRQEVMN